MSSGTSGDTATISSAATGGAAAAPAATSGGAAGGPFFLLLWLRVIGVLGLPLTAGGKGGQSVEWDFAWGGVSGSPQW